VFLELKKAILEGSLKPGQQISENKIDTMWSLREKAILQATCYQARSGREQSNALWSIATT
jgi:hypothetical protein